MQIKVEPQARDSCTSNSTVLYIIDIPGLPNFYIIQDFGPCLNHIKMGGNRIYVYYISII